MALPVTIPNTFANATAAIPLSQLDSNFTTLSNVINQINAGTQQLSNANVAVLIMNAGTSAAPSITFTGDTNTGIFSPAADTIAFAEGGVEGMRIDSSGNVLVKQTSNVTQPGNYTPNISASGLNDGGIAHNQYSTTAGTGAQLWLARSKSATIGQTIVASGDQLGAVNFSGSDGTNFVFGARIIAEVDGTPGTNDMPGRLRFLTTADGASSSTERMRIDSSGNVGIGTTSPAVSGLEISRATGSASPTPAELRIATTTSASDWSTTSPWGRLSFYSADGSSAGPKIQATIDAIATGSGGGTSNIVFQSAADSTGTLTECMRITSGGNLLVGGTTTTENIYSILDALTIQTPSGGYIGLFRNDTSVSGVNPLGGITFYGNDTTGNAVLPLAYVDARASGTHGAGDNPTDLVFGCTNDGSETVAEFARLSQSGTSGRHFTVTQPTIANSSEIIVGTLGGAAGSNDRRGAIGTTKHSGITNACGFIWIDPEDGTDNYLWVDNSDILRISTTYANIGTTGGTVVGTQTSDERIKNILGPVSYGLDAIKAINPVEFTLKDDAEQTKRIGFIAQQVQPIVPESVYDTKEIIVEGEPTKLGMEYVALIPVLVNAVKELSAKCDALQAEVNALKGQ